MLEQPPSPPPSTLDSRPYAPSPVRCPSAPRLLTLSRIATTQIPFIATPGMKSKSSHVVRNFSLSNLAALNHERYAKFEPSSLSSAVTEPADERYKQAMYAFDGDAYKGLDSSSLSEPAVSYAQANLRILCGLYGQLKPLDLIQPYR